MGLPLRRTADAPRISELIRKTIDTVAIIGLGEIGTGWAAFFLSKGLQVNAYDANPNALAHSRSIISSLIDEMQKFQPIADLWEKRLFLGRSLQEAVLSADYIQESASEDLATKQAIFAEIDQYADPEAIIASSTSGLSITDIQKGCTHPERCLTVHPLLPAHIMPLVEILGGEKTAPQTPHIAKDIFLRLGKAPIVLKKELPGLAVNRFQVIVFHEALRLIRDGVATAEDIDAIFVNGLGLRWTLTGPMAATVMATNTLTVSETLKRFGPMHDEILSTMTPVARTQTLLHQIDHQVRSLNISSFSKNERNLELLRLIHKPTETNRV